MSKLVAANPQFAEVVAASFAGQSYLVGLDARLVEIMPGRVVIEAPNSGRIGQQAGLIHGGVLGALGDTAGGYAALTLFPADADVVTIEYKINFMRPARGSLIRAVGEVVRAGRTVTVSRIEVSTGEQGALEPVAILLGTFMKVGPA